MRSLRSERGQTSVEYVGVVVVVAALIGLFAAASPSLAQPLVCKIESAMATIGIGSGCSSSSGDQATTPDLKLCTIADSKRGASGSIKAFSVKLGGDLSMTRTQRGDGKYTVTLNGNGSGGGSGQGGGEVHGEWGKSEGGGGESGKVDAELRAGGAATWVFDDKKSADAFADQVQDDGLSFLGAAAMGPVGIGTYLGGKLAGALGIGGDKPTIPAPDIVMVKGGGAVTASGDATVAEGKLEGSGALGFKYDRSNPDAPTKTAFYELGGSGSGSVAALLGADVSGSGQLAVTFDEDNEPVSVSVTGTASGTGGLATKVKLPGSGALKDLTIPGGGEKDGARIDVTATLPLKDHPENVAALQQLLSDPVGGGQALAQGFANSGQFTAQAYSLDSNKYGAGFSLGDGLSFGLDGGVESTDADLIKAWYWNPTSNGIQTWAQCAQ